MRKQVFCNAIEDILKVREAEDAVNRVISMNRAVYQDTYLMSASALEGTIVNLLTDFFEIPEEDDIISWWIYEMDCGKDFKIGDLSFRDVHGNVTEPDLTTPGKFFDYLVEQYGI